MTWIADFYVVCVAPTVGLWAVFMLIRNESVYRVRRHILHGDGLDAYYALPDYDDMMHPRYWTLWTEAHWRAWVARNRSQQQGDAKGLLTTRAATVYAYGSERDYVSMNWHTRCASGSLILTPAEARKFADMLQGAADLADGLAVTPPEAEE